MKIDDVIEEIQQKGFKTILVQPPEGLKDEALDIADKLESLGLKVYVLGSATYGACDLPDYESKFVKADCILHLGHSQMINSEIPVIYVEYEYKPEIDEVLFNDVIEKIQEYKNIGISTTIQYVKLLGELKKRLEAKGHNVHIGNHGPRTKYDGQILGCDVGSVMSVDQNVDAHVYWGQGMFHPLAIAMASKKPVLIADTGEHRAHWVNMKKYLKRRFALIESAKDAKRVGILLTTKRGQYRPKLAKYIKRIAKENGRHAYFIIQNEIDPLALGNYTKIDAFVNTACPRLATDDDERFHRPILTVQEFEIALGIRKWEDYVADIWY